MNRKCSEALYRGSSSLRYPWFVYPTKPDGTCCGEVAGRIKRAAQTGDTPLPVRKQAAPNADEKAFSQAMLTFFRNFFKSKIGLAITLAFLGLIGFAFASMDVSSSGTFGGVAGGDSVAVVGGRKIGTAELNRAANDALREARQENPNATMQTLLANGGLERILDDLVNRYAIIAWAEENGFRAGDNLVNSEIRQIPAARGASGDFDASVYQQFLRANSLTDAQVRQQFRTSLFFQQTVLPLVYGSTLPNSVAETYARTFKERRTGSIAALPFAAFAPEGSPTDKALQTFYDDNRTRFVRPERRTVRYATFDSSALGDSIEPTQEEIAAYYKENAAQYAASETRSFTQLIVPTREGAQAIAARVRGGESFAQAAQSAGLRPAELADQSRSSVRSSASAAVADAYFSASEGAVTAPAQGQLGWYVARVDSVERRPARDLASVRDEIADTLREQKRQRGIAELAVSIEDRLIDGASLTSIAQELDLELQETRPITASGQIYGTPEPAPEALRSVLEYVFQIDEGEAEIGALPDQQTFLVYEVTDITPSAVAPLAQIKDQVTAAWRADQASKAAKAAADRILKRVEDGASLAEAVSAEEERLPPVQDLSLSREELVRMQNQRVPAAIGLMFAMAEGTVKKLEEPSQQSWFVVDLKDVELEELDENDPLIGQAKNSIGQAWGSEYAEQLLAAMRAAVGVERNADAIAAVRRQLLGEPN